MLIAIVTHKVFFFVFTLTNNTVPAYPSAYIRHFSVCGKERYLEVTKNNRRGMIGGFGGSTETEKYDIFFFEDLLRLG